MRKRQHRRQRHLQFRDPDTAVLDQLRRLGDNLSRERLIHFYLYFPSEQNADRASDQLVQTGFSVECQRSGGGSKWLCLATKNMLPRLADLYTARTTCERIARGLDGEFDGWETQVDIGELEGTS